jgi:hypothetical protein
MTAGCGSGTSHCGLIGYGQIALGVCGRCVFMMYRHVIAVVGQIVTISRVRPAIHSLSRSQSVLSTGSLYPLMSAPLGSGYLG